MIFMKETGRRLSGELWGPLGRESRDPSLASAKRYQNGIAEMNSLLSKTVQVESLQVDDISIPAIYAKDARFRSFFQLLQSQSAPEFAIWESTMLLSQFLERPTKHRSACRSRLRLDITKTDKHSCYIIIA